jgi:hypothetical protein
VLKRTLRSVARRARDWVTEGSAEVDPETQPTATAWLNAEQKKILHKSDGWRRPNYSWGVLYGVHLAASLKIPRVSVLEFGVAGGNGLVSLELIAKDVEAIFGVGIDVYGFDVGTGLPAPVDHRDSPNLFQTAAFPMDVQKLQSRLTKAKLILGDVDETVPKFVASGSAPVAFIAFDLDLWSSTNQALKVFDAPSGSLLPRVYSYFDDTLGMTHNEFAGERLAIQEFNAGHETRKIAQIPGLKHFVLPSLANQWWVDSFYLAHIFDHEMYNRPDGLVKTTRMDLEG